MRIIPAHAGQTTRVRYGRQAASDHPRACGANPCLVNVVSDCAGSSPRMRGKLATRICRTANQRIIPAHAGQTMAEPGFLATITDHPRACGANPTPIRPIIAGVGSSPRMRGKPRRRGRHALRGRIIPAHAGQTSSTYTESSWITDHPRACGANPQIFTDKEYMIGSSPRMRGKLHQVQRATYADRIIPAHAGQTPPDSPPVVFHPDHPRACGANAAVRRSFMIPSGSSPRMRGKHRIIVGAKMEPRIIPAHAGQTIVPRHPRTMCPDHPRACGANLESNASSCCATGSSPRMRGKRRR